MNHCQICGKDYANYQSLWKHKKRYHDSSSDFNKLYVCNYCDKKTTRKWSLNRHLKTCKKNPENNLPIEQINREEFKKQMTQNLSKEQILNMFNQKNQQYMSNAVVAPPIIQPIIQQLIVPDGQSVYSQPVYSQPIQQQPVYPQHIQIQPLEQQPIQLEAIDNNENNPVATNIASNQHNIQSNNTQSNNANSNNTQTNSNNTQTNINIQLVPLGQENLTEVLSTNEQVKILKQKNKSLETIIKYVHFNQKYPQFQNIALKETNSNIGHMYNDEANDFIEVAKDDLIIDLIENRMNDIYDFMVENKANISDKNYKIIESFGQKFNIPIHQDRQRGKVEYLLYGATKDLTKKKLILKSK
jgi:hypothetical protein